MAECIILIFVVFIILWIPYKHYEPRIDVVVLPTFSKVYLWYNKWDGPEYQGRDYKYLFKI